MPNPRPRAWIALLAGASVALATAGVAAAQHAPKRASASAARPWMNARLSPDRRAALVLARMTRAEKLQLVFGYFGTDFPPKNGFKMPEGARPGSAGYIPPIPRLGLPPAWA